jgi:hypothetical protein
VHVYILFFLIGELKIVHALHIASNTEDLSMHEMTLINNVIKKGIDIIESDLVILIIDTKSSCACIYSFLLNRRIKNCTCLIKRWYCNEV